MNVDKNIRWSPLDYVDAAVIAREAGDEMMARLELMTIQPKVIIDAGCGTGELGAQLQSRYADAFIISLDASELMLRHMQSSTSLSGMVCAMAERMPVRDHSVDLIVANMLIPWCQDLTVMLKEWRRVLRPDGLLMISALGLDTLREWGAILSPEETPTLVDMHDIGDAMVQEGYADPVLDVNYLTTCYRDKDRLLQELRATGMWFPSQPQSVTAEEQRVLELTYEVIHAHAFAPVLSDEISASADGVVRVPLSHLRQRLRIKN